jgi:hypothetical protein
MEMDENEETKGFFQARQGGKLSKVKLLWW